jgi:Down syndrome cell adhesion protein 1
LDSFQSGEVQVGRIVELPCIASGYPNPTIRWLKDGRPLPADSRWTRRLTGLTVSDLRLDDSGNYICEVTNSFGSKEVTGHLNVIGESQVTRPCTSPWVSSPHVTGTVCCFGAKACRCVPMHILA